MTTLADIPTASIEMPCAPFVDEHGKLILWRAIKDPVVAYTIDNVARITGYVSAPLFVSEKLREIVAAVVERTGAKVAVSGTPWKTGKGEFIPLSHTRATAERIGDICDELSEWQDAIGRYLDWINIYDEAIKLDDGNQEGFLARDVALWKEFPWFMQTAFYNARMVREHDVYPYVHPCVPGPSHCSMYLNNNYQNGQNLERTQAVLRPWEWPVVANVLLNKCKVRTPQGRYNKGYEAIGAEPKHFREQGEIIRKVGCSAVVVSECPLVLDGGENPDVVANLGALVEGMNNV